MNCSPVKNVVFGQCYEVPNMKVVRANFLWHTKQHDRLFVLRNKIYSRGRLLNLISFNGDIYRWEIV
jgi:hypothetical protein